jgi:putative membrane protein
MKRSTWWLALTLSGMAAASPGLAASLAPTGPAQPMPELGAVPVALPVAEDLTAGSAALVPLMAADLPAEEAHVIDTSAPAGGGDVGKPIDDISFLARATESARQEMSAARDALPLLLDPELKRVAELLIREYGDADERMTRIAEAKMWPVPAPQRDDTPPAGAATADFDAVWTEDMISAHERSLALYSAQAQGGEDADLRKYARDTLPTIQHHLAELRRLQK